MAAALEITEHRLKSPPTVTVRTRCPDCKKDVEVKDIPRDAFESWFNGGALIQDALSMLSADQREVLLTGICGPCFESMFAESEVA